MFAISYLLPIADRYWVIHLAATHGFFDSHQQTAILSIVLVGVIVIVALVAATISILTMTRQQELAAFNAKWEQSARFESAHHAHRILISFVVHEQRNPLHLASGSIEMLKDALVTVQTDLRSVLQSFRQAIDRDSLTSSKSSHSEM